MQSTSEPYLQVDAVGADLNIYWMAMVQRIRHGIYDVRLGDTWVKLGAGEGHVNTGGPPVRWLMMWGNGPDAEQILLLDAQLRASKGPLQIKGNAGETLDLFLRSVRYRLFVTGTFLTKGDEDEFPCRITLPEGREIAGFAAEAGSGSLPWVDARWKGIRVLSFYEMALDDQIDLIRAVTGGSTVLVERLPWP